MASPYPVLLQLAHTNAVRVSQVDPSDEEVSLLLATALNGPSRKQLLSLIQGRADEATRVGDELHRGYTSLANTRKIRNTIKRLLAHNLDFFLAAVELVGYDRVLVRAAIEHHWRELKAAAPGDDQYLIYLDVQQARLGLEGPCAEAITLLCAGYTPREIRQLCGQTALYEGLVTIERKLRGRGV